MKKILEWILGDGAATRPETKETERKARISKCIDEQSKILLSIEKLSADQKIVFCKGMDYACSLDEMLRLMTNEELKDYTKRMTRIQS